MSAVGVAVLGGISHALIQMGEWVGLLSGTVAAALAVIVLTVSARILVGRIRATRRQRADRVAELMATVATRCGELEEFVTPPESAPLLPETLARVESALQHASKTLSAWAETPERCLRLPQHERRARTVLEDVDASYARARSEATVRKALA